MAKNREKDPVTGISLNRLTNYNNSEPVEYRTDINLGNLSIPGSSPMIGSTGDVNLFNYEASKYDNSILPYELDNLSDIRSQNQGIFDSLGRATANLVGKTAVNVVGGLVGTAYGATEAIKEGRVSALWDNELTTSLDKASEAIGDYFRVYKSNDFNERNLITRAVLNPVQFTDELMDTLSFTTGAVLTEMISGGLSSGMVIPRALKYFKGLNKASKAAEAGAELANTSNALFRGLGNAGTLSRQLATGAAYEAAVEARHASMELRDTLYNQWLEDNPGASIEDMSEEDRNSIDDRLSDAGLFTFLTNIALVGGSNIVQFPKVFGAGYNTSKRAQDLSQRITRNAAGEFVDSAVPTTRAGRITSSIATAARNPIMEGLVEEGGQGVISGTANDFFARKFDLDSKTTVEDFLTSFGKSLIETYTTAEGWEEIGMGMIIGSLGMPSRGAMSLFGRNTRLGQYGFNEDGTRRELWDGGIVGSFRERAEQTAEIANYIEELNNNTSLIEAMKANYDFLVQADSLDKSMDIALQNNDVFNFNNFRDDKIHAYISSRLKAGLSSDLDTTIEQLQRTSPEDLYLEFRGQEALDIATEQELANFKQSTIKEFQDKIEATKEAYDIVDNAYTGDNDEIRDYFAHSIATAKYLDIREESINTALSDLSNGSINNLNIRGTDIHSLNQEIDRLNSLKESEELSDQDKIDIDNLIKFYQNIPDKQRQLTVDEYQNILSMQNSDPVTLSLNLNKITELLDDSRKLRNRRQSFINDYNNIFTQEGIERIQRQQRKYLRDQEKARESEEEAIRQAEAEQAKLDEELRVQDRKAEIKSKKEAAELKKNEVAEEVEEIDPFANMQQASLLDENGDTVSDSEIVDIESQIQELETNRLNELALAEENWANNVDERGFPIEALPPILDDINNRYDNQINSLREQSEITPEEEAVITNIEQEESYEGNKLLNQDGLVMNPSQEDKNSKRQIYLQDNWFKRDVGNTIISLNIDYNKYSTFINGNLETNITDIIDDEGRVRINENFDSRLQDPNQFNKGTTVDIIIPTYQQILDKGIGGEGYSESDYNKYIDDVDMFPIAFTDNEGNIIGYLPTQTNVKNNVNPEYLKTELIKNKELRQQIFDNRDSNITANITDKSSGTPIFQRYNQSIYNALGDGSRLADGVSIGVFKEGKLQTGINNPYQGNVKLPDGISNDEYFNDGYIYAVIPTAKEGEHFAINMDVNTISESDSNSIIKILELYKANPKFAGDANLVNERESLSVEVDFNNIQEVNRALESILYINNDNDNYMFRMDSNKLILGLTPDMQFTWTDFRKQATKDKIKDILSKRYYAVRLANFGNPFNSYSVSENGQLDIVRNRNYFDYLNNNNVIQSNIQSEPISNKANERYFTAQSVIEIGNVNIQSNQPGISPSKEVLLKSDTSTSQEGNRPTGVPKTRLGLKIKPNRNKPNIEEDLAEISTPNLSLDKEAELLMKKCSK